MSPHDYERLGILAVKTGVTRQELLKDALAQFLAAKAQDYRLRLSGRLRTQLRRDGLIAMEASCERNWGEAAG